MDHPPSISPLPLGKTGPGNSFFQPLMPGSGPAVSSWAISPGGFHLLLLSASTQSQANRGINNCTENEAALCSVRPLC